MVASGIHPHLFLSFLWPYFTILLPSFTEVLGISGGFVFRKRELVVRTCSGFALMKKLELRDKCSYCTVLDVIRSQLGT